MSKPCIIVSGGEYAPIGGLGEGSFLIACDRGYAWPCGICRQVLNEFKAGDMGVFTGSFDNEWKMMKLSDLLPEGFGPECLSLN